MNLDQIATKCFILALFIRDDGQRLLLGDGYYDFNQKLQHFQANTIANDVVETQTAPPSKGAEAISRTRQPSRKSSKSSQNTASRSTSRTQTTTNTQRTLRGTKSTPTSPESRSTRPREEASSGTNSAQYQTAQAISGRRAEASKISSRSQALIPHGQSGRFKVEHRIQRSRTSRQGRPSHGKDSCQQDRRSQSTWQR